MANHKSEHDQQPASENPYEGLPSRCYWRPAVADRHVASLEDLWIPPAVSSSDRFASAGSCFAQHIGRELRDRGLNYLDVEPIPAFIPDRETAKRHGYDLFSARYGNIYTTRQLVQLAEEACNVRVPMERVWTRGGRFFDALRPSVDPVGHGSPEEVLSARAVHLERVRALLSIVDVFVFTLGLTEAWTHTTDGTVYPIAPGVLAGAYDPARYRLLNLTARDVLLDLQAFFKILRSLSPRARLILTVSPVPLTATATGLHVLTASTYSKAVLRAAAGESASRSPDVHYFPSYEIISSHVSRGMFFEPNLRGVNEMGVKCVMKHFFIGDIAALSQRAVAARPPRSDDAELMCDEARLDQYAGGQP